MLLLKSAIRNPKSEIEAAIASRPRGRTAFTLIEILLVLGIMLVLMAIGIGAAMKGYQWVLRNNTEVVMRKVEERMARRREAIFREARAWETPNIILRIADGDKRRAEVLKVKLIYKWSFPMNYAEAVANVVESSALGYGYAANGHPVALAIRSRLASRIGGTGGPTLSLTQRGLMLTRLQNELGLTAAQALAFDLRNQNSACLSVIFETTLGTSVDELAPSEIGRYPTHPTNEAVAYDNNPLIIDAWGTPLFFMRYGNLVTGWHNAENPAAPFYWLRNVLGPTPDTNIPANQLSGTFGGQPWTLAPNNFGRYYTQILERAKAAFPTKYQAGQQQAQDPDDPEGLLAVQQTLGWQRQSSSWWVYPSGPVTVNNADDTAATQSGFSRVFGYRLASDTNQIKVYAPLLILSAGGDRDFQTWDDNLDSYRLTARVGNQQ